MFLIFFIYLLLEVYLLFISKIFNFIIVKKDLHAGFLHFEFPIVPQKLYLKKKTYLWWFEQWDYKYFSLPTKRSTVLRILLFSLMISLTFRFTLWHLELHTQIKNNSECRTCDIHEPLKIKILNLRI